MSTNYAVNATTTRTIKETATITAASFQTVVSPSDGESRNAAEKQRVLSSEGAEKEKVKSENTTSETHEDKQTATTTMTTTGTKEPMIESKDTGSENHEKKQSTTAATTGRKETKMESEDITSEICEKKQTAIDIGAAGNANETGRNQGVQSNNSVKNCDGGKEERSTRKVPQKEFPKTMKTGPGIFCKEDRLIEKGPASVYRIPLTEIGHNRHRFGDIVNKRSNKTIMMVGATGSGKTTLINAMINHILKVERKDDFRFKLVAETTNKSQAHSQTSEIIAYEIIHREGFAIPFSLTIIDTPGFGDTRGMERDKEIVEQMRTFFSQAGGIDQIDCICFVVQAALARLTLTQNYIFNSILSIFGKDIEENIQILVTFADGQAPPVLTAIEEADVPCSKTKGNHPVHFKFNNSAVFAKCSENTNDDGGSDSDADEFDEMFWKMGTKSMEKYFTALGKMETKSLTLTKEVLKERKRRETALEGLQPQINAGLVKLEELRKTTAALEQHKTLVDANKDFEFEVEITVPEQEIVKGFITNCQRCHFTCHDSCLYGNDEDKYKCSAMTNRKCTVCPGKCVWNVHSNQKYKWKYVTKKEKKTYGELKKKYEEALGEKMTTEKMFQQLQMELDVCEQKVLELVEETSQCLKRLNEIALRPNPLQTPEYIDLLIEGEKQEAKAGFKERIKSLNGLRECAVIIAKIANNEPLLPREKVQHTRTQNVLNAVKSGMMKVVSAGKGLFMD
uniref:uncharacterized protein n=1 Tax=Myxine glutinosa TaxID=7769 RepID=UPI00358E700B